MTLLMASFPCMVITMTVELGRSLNIALIVPYMYIELYYYFSFYGNVFIQTYEPYYHGPYLGSRLRFLSHEYMHGAAGFIGWKLGSKRLARLLAKLLNPRHKFQPMHIPFDLRLSDPERIDLVIVVELLCRYDLRPYRNAVKVYWAIDSFTDRRIFMYENLPGLEDYDIVFVAHRKGLERLRAAGFPVKLLPLALHYEWIYRPMPLEKKFDVVFVGRLLKSTHSRRARILRELYEKLRARGVKVFNTAAWHHDAAKLYNSSRIVLNVSRAGEINLRVFEVLGTRSFVLNDDGEVRLLFEPGRHIETFSDVDEAVEKIIQYLEDDEARERIAAEGHRLVLERHTMFHRVEELLESAGLGPEVRWSRSLPRILQGSEV